MSLQTWKAEFYPQSAAETLALKIDDTERTELALAHSIQKWRGLTPAALARHQLKVVDGDLFPSNGADETFGIDAESCALCMAFPGCKDCPLYGSRDNVSCDSTTAEEAHSPFFMFSVDSDPQPMIDALEKARQWIG